MPLRGRGDPEVAGVPGALRAGPFLARSGRPRRPILADRGDRGVFHALRSGDPATEGRAFQLGEGEFTLGRDPASSLVLDERGLSRRHAVIRRGPSGWEIRDLGSSNGIRVKGHRMDAALLSEGDEIRVGLFRPRLLRRPGPARSRAAGPRLRRPRLRLAGVLRPGLGRGAPRPPSASSTEGRPWSPRRGSGARRTPAVHPRRRSRLLEPEGVPSRGGRPTATAPPEPTPAAPLLPDEPLPPASAWPPPPDPVVEAEVDRAAASLEAAFRAGNVDEVFVHVHPAATESLRAAFGPRAAELPRVAMLLATRKLVVAEEAWAEYEVTEDGRAFAVVFEKVEGRWLLSSL